MKKDENKWDLLQFWYIPESVLSTIHGISVSLPRRRSFAGCGGHLNLDICCAKASTPSDAPGRFLIALDPLARRVTACALSVIAARCQIPPFITCGDIFPRSGGSLSSKGEPRALPETFSLCPNTLATSFRPWLPPWGSWRGSA